MNHIHIHPRKRRSAISGFSLVELLVAVTIGLVLTLAITSVMTRSESTKRTITSTNDANQTGAYVSYELDRALRSAGSGYAQRWREVFGCQINASRDNAAMLPSPTALPAPFDGMPQAFRLAPLVITKGADSDVLAIMTGAAGVGESGLRVVQSSVVAGSLGLPNALGIRGNDLILLAQDGIGCMVQQVTAGFEGTPLVAGTLPPQDLPLSGRFYNATGTDVSLTDFGVSGDTYVMGLGNALTNAPQFQLIGVGANNTLVSYDILRIDGTDAPVPIAENVVQLRALYGVDTDNDSRQDAWVDPGVAPWDSVSLLNGSEAARDNLRRIVAVRVGLILASSLVERTNASPTSITLFGDIGMGQTRALTADEQRVRHRAVEITVPLRTILMLPPA